MGNRSLNPAIANEKAAAIRMAAALVNRADPLHMLALKREVERLRMLVCTCHAYEIDFSAEGPPPHRADCPAVGGAGG